MAAQSHWQDEGQAAVGPGRQRGGGLRIPVG